MSKFFRFLGAFIVLGMLGTTSALAVGSGAYRLELSDAGAAGKGSAFVGEANTAAAVYYNPAGMTQVKGTAMSMGAMLLQTHIDYKSNAGEASQMRNGNFVIPATFLVTNLGMEKMAFGFGALTSWGLTTYWNPDSFARYAATRSVMENHDYILSAAYQLTEQISLGLGALIDDSELDKQKKLYQGSGVDGNFRLKGEADGIAPQLSAMYKLNDRHQFGLIYRGAIEHKYKGKIILEGLDNSAPYFYQTVFGGTSYETDVIAKTTLPDSVVFGYSYKPGSKWTFNMDIEWMNWSTTNKEELAYPSESDPTRLAVLNNGNPASRDWMSMFSGALGTEYKMSDVFRLRGGYYYRQSPIPGDTWEPNLPDSDSHGVTLGCGYDIIKSLTLDLAWSGIIYNARVVDTTQVDALGGVDGTYRQWDNLLYATLSYKF